MIRCLEERDIASCLALMEIVKADFPGYQERTFRRALGDAIAKSEAVAAYCSAELTGLISFSYPDKEITALAVHPNHRRNGIAKRLIEEVKCRIPLRSTIRVVTFRNDDPRGAAAVACYRACGFVSGDRMEAYGYPCQEMILLR